MQCPQCGHQNQEGDRFCSNCGSRLDTTSSIPRQFAPPDPGAPTDPSTPSSDPRPDDPSDPEWRMSPLPPEEPPKRRTWLWVLIGLIVFCVLLFCGFMTFVTFTDTGQDMLNNLATQAAELATPVDE